MLSKRLITGPILIICFLALIAIDQSILAWQSNVLPMLPEGSILMLLCLLISVPACIELSQLAQSTGRRTATFLTIAATWTLLVTMWIQSSSSSLPGITMLVIGATWWAALIVHTKGQRTDGVLADASVTTAIVVYLGMLGFYLILRQDVSAWWIAAIVLITKSCDIGAYTVGVSIGKHKLIPWLSPGKTVEGLIGGVATAAGTAVIASMWLESEGLFTITPLKAVLLGSLLGLAGQIGDLTMSLLKRDATQKDSGSSLPGMGGIMDVIDSLLLAAPIGWLVLMNS